MPSLVVIRQQIKEKRRGHIMPPSLYNNKVPQPEQVNLCSLARALSSAFLKRCNLVSFHMGNTKINVFIKKIQLGCVKSRVQNLMKNGIQNLFCMSFNLFFCKNHYEILTVNVNVNFSNFLFEHAQIHRNINC